jgi:hypothetical protein
VPRQATLIVLLVASLAAGCGQEVANTPQAPRAADPALARQPKRPGEIVVRGEASPRSHGPFQFRGHYTVRFEQSAPEDPALDFSTQTSFVAGLDRRPEEEAADSVRLFRSARRSGRRRISVDGRYYVDIAFGDFPYAIRFSPAK